MACSLSLQNLTLASQNAPLSTTRRPSVPPAPCAVTGSRLPRAPRISTPAQRRQAGERNTVKKPRTNPIKSSPRAATRRPPPSLPPPPFRGRQAHVPTAPVRHMLADRSSSSSWERDSVGLDRPGPIGWRFHVGLVFLTYVLLCCLKYQLNVFLIEKLVNVCGF